MATADTPLGDRLDMAFMNTQVTRGAGEVLVTATGMATEVGHISYILQTTKLEQTPLTKQLNTLTKQPPRPSGEQILPVRLAVILVAMGLVMAASALGVIQFAVAGMHWSDTVARTMGLTTFTFTNIFFALETNDELRTVFSRETLESYQLLRMCGWSLLAAFLAGTTTPGPEMPCSR